MQHDAAISSSATNRLPQAIVRAVLISIPLWGVIGAALWLLEAAARA